MSPQSGFIDIIRQMSDHILDQFSVFARQPLQRISVLVTVCILLSLTGLAAFAQQQVFNTGVQTGVQGQDSFLIILDSSESMIESLPDGQSKMSAAKRVILETLQKIPAQVPVGLRVYGDATYNACRATKLLTPIAPNNRYQISGQLANVKPTGMTPISYALATAVNNDFNHLNGKRNIILVSDGIETCGMDPCDLAVQMVQNGVDVKINVVGYGLRELDGIKQLKCAALATKGKFYNTSTAAELASSLDNLLGAKKDVQAKILIPGQAQQRPQAQYRQQATPPL